VPSGSNIFILQARPETVWSAKPRAANAPEATSAMNYIVSGLLSGRRVS